MTHAEADVKGGCIRTFSGRYISLLAPQQEDIVLVDIAHGLAGTFRFVCQSPRRYSVAQHTVVVSYLVARGFELEGLFHDSPEAYLGDVSGPLKHLDEMAPYRRLEDKVMYPAIARKFGLPPQVGPEVHYADKLAYRLECHELFNERLESRLDLEAYLQYKHLLTPLGPQMAKDQWLDRYHMLIERTQG